MLRRKTSILIISSLLVHGPAMAAQDAGLNSGGQTGIASRSVGMGAQASVTIRLGPSQTHRQSDKVVIGLRAGPAVHQASNGGVAQGQHGVSNLAGLNWKPGYSTSFSLAGHEVAKDYTRLGAAEDEKEAEKEEKKPRKKKSVGHHVASVAAVAGGVMVVLASVLVIALATQGPTD